jgi:tripartite-type tricarboxylate transporter receptor subunit TctC
MTRTTLGIIVRVVAFIAAGAAGVAQPARAEDYPSKPIHVIVSTQPGGTVDIVARLIAQKIRSEGVTMVVENRAGAGGAIGALAVARAAPDGYTLGLMTTSFTTNASSRKTSYDAIADFEPVSLVSNSSYVVVCSPSLPVHSIGDLIALAKQKPGAINYSSLGTGGAVHLATEMFDAMAGIKMTHVPYNGTIAAASAILGGQVQVTISSIIGSVQLAKDGKLRLLAVTSAHHSPELPDLPTVAETVPGYEFYDWFGVLAPRGTPAAIVARLNTSINHVLADPEIQARFKQLGVDPAGGSPDALKSLIQKQMHDYTLLVQKLDLHLE